MWREIWGEECGSIKTPSQIGEDIFRANEETGLPDFDVRWEMGELIPRGTLGYSPYTWANFSPPPSNLCFYIGVLPIWTRFPTLPREESRLR